MQLATITKKSVHHWVRSCVFEMNGVPTTTHLNLLPLGSYGMIFCINQLYLHRTKVDWYEKAIKCLDGNWENRFSEGKKKSTSIRIIISMQAKCSYTKWCVMFAVHISSDKGKDVCMKKYLRGTLYYNSFQMCFQQRLQSCLPIGKWTSLLSWYQEKHQHQRHVKG